MEDASGGDTSVSQKTWWGPRIWRILHSLAEIGQGRTDTGSGWLAVLRTTTAILPCAICRDHFASAMRPIRIPTGVRRGLWAAHAATGTETAAMPETELSSVYGGATCESVAALVNEVAGEFRRANVLDRFRVGYLLDWERAVSGLLRLLREPPQPLTSAPPVNRPRARTAATPAVSQASLRGRPTLQGRRYA
jgi:hypothetical protein